MSDRNKTLLPELLPAPRQPASASPRDRVAERARSMLDRLRGLKTTAGAAVLAVHCSGYGVVDPLPPPPAQCTDRSDLFATLSAYGSAVAAADGGLPNYVITLNSYRAIGFRVDAVRVTAGGTLISVEDMSHDGLGGQTLFSITIAPDGSGSRITFEVDLGCGTATTTKHYSFFPMGNGTFVVTEV